MSQVSTLFSVAAGPGASTPTIESTCEDKETEDYQYHGPYEASKVDDVSDCLQEQA